MATNDSEPQTKHFYIGIVDPLVERRISEQFAQLGPVVPLRDLCRQDSMPPFGGSADVVIVSPCILRGARHGGWPRLSRFFDQAYIMVAVGDDDVHAHSDLFGIADGWILGETQLDNFREVLALNTGGYRSFPHALERPRSGASAPSEPIWSLSAWEFASMGRPARRRPARRMYRKLSASLPVIGLVREQASRLGGGVDLSRLAAGLRRSLIGALGKPVTAMTPDGKADIWAMLACVIRIEFLVQIALALHSGEGGASKVLQSLLSYPHAQALIVGCALAGLALRFCVPGGSFARVHLLNQPS